MNISASNIGNCTEANPMDAALARRVPVVRPHIPAQAAARALLAHTERQFAEEDRWMRGTASRLDGGDEARAYALYVLAREGRADWTRHFRREIDPDGGLVPQSKR